MTMQHEPRHAGLGCTGFTSTRQRTVLLKKADGHASLQKMIGVYHCRLSNRQVEAHSQVAGLSRLSFVAVAATRTDAGRMYGIGEFGEDRG